MCTLVVSFQQHPGWPIIVAANRDEVLDRPASGPRRWPGEPFVAPRDEQAGGTWLGLTTGGMFVGVTNRFLAPKHAERSSRGALVLEALRAPDAAALHASLGALPAARFNAFHLLYADARGAYVTWSDGERVQQQALAPGLHVVTERSLGGDDSGRRAAIEAQWPRLVVSGPPTPEALMALLATKSVEAPIDGLTVELPEFNYGTRSALVLLRGARLASSRLFWADGRPDRVPFVERPDLVRALEA